MTEPTTRDRCRLSIRVDPYIIAIDGPAGSGKSSVSKAVARRLGLGFLDTGAAYRALAWHVLAHGADTSDASAVARRRRRLRRARSRSIPTTSGSRSATTDVTAAIREPRVTEAVSGVARVPAVRQGINAFFRALVAASDARASSSRAATSRRSSPPTRPCACC